MDWEPEISSVALSLSFPLFHQFIPFSFTSFRARPCSFFCSAYAIMWGCFLKMFSIKAREAILRET